jgi:hypothetical protein
MFYDFSKVFAGFSLKRKKIPQKSDSAESGKYSENI